MCQTNPDFVPSDVLPDSASPSDQQDKPDPSPAAPASSSFVCPTSEFWQTLPVDAANVDAVVGICKPEEGSKSRHYMCKYSGYSANQCEWRSGKYGVDIQLLTDKTIVVEYLESTRCALVVKADVENRALTVKYEDEALGSETFDPVSLTKQIRGWYLPGYKVWAGDNADSPDQANAAVDSASSGNGNAVTCGQ